MGPIITLVDGPASEPRQGYPDGDSWRQVSLLAIIRVLAVIGAVWVAAVFANVPKVILTGYGITYISIVAVIAFASIARLSNHVRFAIVEAAFLAAAVAGVLVYGYPPGVSVLLGLSVLMASVYYTWKGGLVAGLLSVALLAFGAWGWLAGHLPIGPKVPMLVPTGGDLWVRALFAQAMFVCGSIGVVAFVSREMRLTLTRLQMADEKFTRAFLVCPDALIISDLETGTLIEVNEGHHRLTGFSREEVIGRTSIEIGTFRDREDRESYAAPLRTVGSIRHVERQMKNKAGETIDVLVSAERFELGGEERVLTIIQDITEEKRTRAALKANEESFRSFIENAGVGVYRSTPEGKIVMANPALLRIMGFDSFEQMATRNLEAEGYEPGYPRHLFRSKIESEGIVNGLEAAWKKRDGTTMFVRESASVIRGPDGRIMYYDGIIEDISERKNAEADLRESEERFRTLTAAAFEGIVISEDGRVVDINDQGLALIGYDRADVIGRNVVDFVSLEARSTVAENIRNETETVYEHDLIRKDGSRLRVEAKAKVTRMGGRNLRMTALQDVTERRQDEQKRKNLEEQVLQMQKMEALGTLAGGIAHDFNNILTGILGNLQIAAMDLPTNHPAFVALDSADKASRRARELVARILSFSLPRRDNRSAASLGTVVLEAVELLRVGLPGGIDIKTDVGSECPKIECDPGQIHQVILNLGTNSAHAMREKGGTIYIEVHAVRPDSELCALHPQVTPNHVVRLTLRDEGSGMDDAVIKRIFEPFYTTKKFGQGTGLGLAMVHTILKSHNGAIVVESVPGSGTCFSLYFPAASGVEPEPKPAASPPKRRGIVPFGNGRSIMLVDDEDTVLNIGANLIRRLGFVPMAYALPKEALMAYAQDPNAVCAVISDLTMPEMTGLELARHMLKKRPDLPVILTTGYLHSDAQKNAQESGVMCVVTKPFDVKELVSKIRLILNEPEDTSS